MDPLLPQLRDVYRQNPKFVIAFLGMHALIGLYFGYRVLGPALAG